MDLQNPTVQIKMTKIPTLLLLCSPTIIILVLYIALVNSNGLTMKLIHPNSPESPFFHSQPCHEKKIKILASQSNIRANYVSNTSSSSTTHAQIDVQLFHYIVKIGIGTFKSKPPYKEYYLEMDTGSSLIWLQCAGCTKCYKQTPTPFPKEKSSSFRPVIDENKHVPAYECKYHDGDNTRGILARETFHLVTKKGGLAKFENIQFGCGLHNEMQFGDYRNNKIAGIMGLGWDDISFVNQLGYKSEGKFSYCLPVISSGKAPSTYLRFGDDIVHNKNFKTTPLYRRKNGSHYYVEMQGISINRTRLNISPQVFAFKNINGKSGCIIDTGTPYSRIIAPAFQILKLELEKYFSGSKGLKRIKGDMGLELCYQRSKAQGFKNLPDITFHLQGSQADFVLKAEAAFEVVNRCRLINFREYFCLAMIRDDEKSTIGAHQQTNHRIIHDTKNKQLIFYPEDCSKNP